MAYKLAVFGDPIAHSLSPEIHNFFAQEEGREISYVRIQANTDFKAKVNEFWRFGGVGCNITAPCKLLAYEHAMSYSTRALAVQAVNTLRLNAIDEQSQEGICLGDNTDGLGFYDDLIRLNCPLQDAMVVILGVGAATQGIIAPLLLPQASMDLFAHSAYQAPYSSQAQGTTPSSNEQTSALPNVDSLEEKTAQSGIAHLHLVSRDQAKVATLIEKWRGLSHTAVSVSDYAHLAEVMANKAADKPLVIINSTTLPLKGECPPIEKELLAQAKLVYDLCYHASGETSFTKLAKEAGVQNSHDGLGMLVGQAAVSYQTWFGVKPDSASCLAHIRKLLVSRT